ncbi:hypothetical protein L596_027511 [Steinernema carpocapsae]|uniref:Uncharacterized protein n=1 Tax=Steinernema carpocapsae TaxID=34508 RepID=A0A4U5LVR2_STECR|nr:hypothetical protein L596_027511 [Steinernema carpocapsae]
MPEIAHCASPPIFSAISINLRRRLPPVSPRLGDPLEPLSAHLHLLRQSPPPGTPRVPRVAFSLSSRLVWTPN